MKTDSNISLEEIAETLMRKVSKDGPFQSTNEVFDVLVNEVGLPEDYAAKIIGETRQRKSRPVEFPSIGHLELFVTEECNLRCSYCFVEGKNRYHRMSPETGRKAFDFLIKESGTRKQLVVVFMGGEPLLEFDLIRQLVPYADKQAQPLGKNLSYSLTTNGTLLNEKILRFFAENRINVLLSLDGDRETHDRQRKTLSGEGSFDHVVSNLRLLKTYQPWVGTRLTITPEATNNLLKNVQFLADSGVNQFLFAPATGVKWPQEAKQTFEEESIRLYRWWKEAVKSRPIRIDFFKDIIKDQDAERTNRWGCRAGRNSVAVSARGEIYPCSMMLGLDGLGGVCRLGDVEHGITDVEARGRLTGLGPVQRSQCYRCADRKRCLGGCYASNYRETGDIFKPSQQWECDFVAIKHKVAAKIMQE